MLITLVIFIIKLLSFSRKERNYSEIIVFCFIIYFTFAHKITNVFRTLFPLSAKKEAICYGGWTKYRDLLVASIHYYYYFIYFCFLTNPLTVSLKVQRAIFTDMKLKYASAHEQTIICTQFYSYLSQSKHRNKICGANCNSQSYRVCLRAMLVPETMQYFCMTKNLFPKGKQFLLFNQPTWLPWTHSINNFFVSEWSRSGVGFLLILIIKDYVSFVTEYFSRTHLKMYYFRSV